MNISRVIYWLATLILCGVMMYSASMYFMNTEMVEGFFEHFNYPTYLVIPLAVAKVLGVVMVLWRGSQWLTEWAYAGFFFDVILAFFAHYTAGDSVSFTLITMIALLVSYFFGKEIRS